MRHKALLAAGIAGLLVAGYAAAGYWLAPRLVRDALVAQADRLGLKLLLGDVRSDPFRLGVVLSGIEVQAPDGRTLATAKSASADLALASLWRSGWLVQHASLVQPNARIELGPNGDTNWPVVASDRNAEKEQALAVQQLSLTEGSLHLIDRSRGAPVELKLEALELDVKDLATQSREPARYELSSRVAGGGTVTSHGGISLGPLAAQGNMSVAGVAVNDAWRLAAPGSAAGDGRFDASAAYAYQGGSLTLENVSVTAAAFSYNGIELSQVGFRAPKLVIPSDAPFQLTATANVAPAGRLAAQGSIRSQPFNADLSIKAVDLDLAQAQPWLPARAKVRIVSGTLAANGRLQASNGAASYEGAVAVRDARVDELDSGRLLLGWKSLQTDGAKLSFAPFGAELGELVAQGPTGRLVIEAGGGVNFAEAVGKGDGGKNDVPVQATLRRLRVENGTLDFADRSLQTPFAITVSGLTGSVEGLSTVRGEPAQVRLEGRVEKRGSASISGTINPRQPRALVDLSARFRNLDLAEFTPYTVKFAGYRIASGRLFAQLRYQVRDGELEGSNAITIQGMQLGEKVDSASVLDLPLDLAVALLSDSNGRIDLDIPVTGSLSDPKFDIAGLVRQAIGDSIGRIVSAPFRALGALFGGGEQKQSPSEVHFDRGSATLSPAQQETVAQVASALEARPQLAVLVRGGYDLEADFAESAGGAAVAGAVKRAPIEATGLALERARAVRAALLERGIAPSRVRLDAPAAKEADKGGVPTALDLVAVREPAQQQAGAAPQASEVVRQVQTKLNGDGFAVGPADGILGPMTQRGLRRYQESKGLPPTGGLDEPTLSAIGVDDEAFPRGATGQ